MELIPELFKLQQKKHSYDNGKKNTGKVSQCGQ